jgi:hypothetical protein
LAALAVCESLCDLTSDILPPDGAKGEQPPPCDGIGQGEIAVGRNDDQELLSPRADAAHGAPPAMIVPLRRNRMLAMALVSVAASVFAMVVTLVVLFHYAETHHLLANL